MWSQRFYNILATYLLYSSSYTEISQTYKLEAIVLHCVKATLCHVYSSSITSFTESTNPYNVMKPREWRIWTMDHKSNNPIEQSLFRWIRYSTDTYFILRSMLLIIPHPQDFRSCTYIRADYYIIIYIYTTFGSMCCVVLAGSYTKFLCF